MASSSSLLFGIRVFFASRSKSGTSSFFREEVNLVRYFKNGSATSIASPEILSTLYGFHHLQTSGCR